MLNIAKTMAYTISACMAYLLLTLWVSTFIEAQTKTKWFSYTNGDTTCIGSKIANTVPQINLQCSNPRGTVSAGYTASPAHQTQDTLIFGVTSQAPANSMTCLVGINSTSTSGTFGALGIIPGNSAAAQCGVGSPTTLQVWP